MSNDRRPPTGSGSSAADAENAASAGADASAVTATVSAVTAAAAGEAARLTRTGFHPEGARDGEHLHSQPPPRPDGSSAPRVGVVEVICGSMFSGKTEELLRRIKRAKLARQHVLLFKPRVDNRYDEVKVVTHEGLNADAVPVSDARELMATVDAAEAAFGKMATARVGFVIGIDEAQFFGDEIVAAADALANRGARVIAAGLDQDYRGQPFGPMPRFMSVAEYVTKLHAVCAQCGAPASRSQRIVASEGQLFVGGSAAYEARCRRCFVAGVVGD